MDKALLGFMKEKYSCLLECVAHSVGLFTIMFITFVLVCVLSFVCVFICMYLYSYEIIEYQREHGKLLTATLV